MSQWIWVRVVILMILCLPALGAVSTDQGLQVARVWGREDGPIENLTAVCYFVAAVCFLVLAARSRFRNLICLGLAAMFLFVAGEEVSWFQRFGGWDTPEVVREVNVQRELNLHNLDGIHQHVRVVGCLIMLFLCVVIPLVDMLSERARQLLRKVGFPIFPLWLAVVALTGMGLMIISRWTPELKLHFGDNLDELSEIYLGIAYMGYGLKSIRERQVAPEAAEASSGSLAAR